ncbi:hydantoinase B/oxoprolinase family protein [Halorubrum sp. JWXQ-INN 858]|uniref:hydantoinase B/oxoprolinase family protein n=1 Tax=Halorubrum sp. JWXQ-INN 858 TaxID=2690782 RepID=UPI00135A7FF0|nr:hydantoinase B/oxoprolinase family protein [Halorubrum sp. JWXQ-INN 858]MWV63224.1 hydantoinase B/oxoprolinase family protein [Halorubrum sp. JWXQ-INN 858]
MTIDEITQSVLRHKFDAIADEMETTLIRSAYSSIVKEAQDASAAVFDPDGRTIAQAMAIPAHLGMMVPAVESILDAFPVEEMEPEDVYLMNDPYDGGTHIPDITVVKPVFNDGEVIALGATMAHHQEMGGLTPGSLPPNATEIYQEGLRLPPLQYHDRGEINETLVSLIEKNVRTPYTTLGDLRAQVSSVSIANRRIGAVAGEYGNEAFGEVVDRIIDHAERLTRSKIAEIPDGSYAFHDFIDDDGVEMHQPIRIEATVTVDGSDMHVDFTGTGAQAKGPVNSVPSATLSGVYYVVRAITDPTIPNNAGCFLPVEVTMPEGSLVNPLPPAPVNARSLTVKRIVDVLFGALAEAAPESVTAAGNGQLLSHRFSGFDDDERWIYGEVGAGGSGARPTKDGLDCIDTDITNCMNTPVEATELSAPIRVRRYDLWRDSGGPGKHRGGLGYRKQFEPLVDGVTFTHRRDRHDFPPWGIHGGRPAPTCRTDVHRTSGETESLPSQAIVRLDAGDVVDVHTTGGGGYGRPIDRPVEAVVRDLREDRVSEAVAETEYGVVLADGGVDREATRARRDRLRAERPAGTFDRGDGRVAD